MLSVWGSRYVDLNWTMQNADLCCNITWCHTIRYYSCVSVKNVSLQNEGEASYVVNFLAGDCNKPPNTGGDEPSTPPAHPRLTFESATQTDHCNSFWTASKPGQINKTLKATQCRWHTVLPPHTLTPLDNAHIQRGWSHDCFLHREKTRGLNTWIFSPPTLIPLSFSSTPSTDLLSSVSLFFSHFL